MQINDYYRHYQLHVFSGNVLSTIFSYILLHVDVAMGILSTLEGYYMLAKLLSLE